MRDNGVGDPVALVEQLAGAVGTCPRFVAYPCDVFATARIRVGIIQESFLKDLDTSGGGARRVFGRLSAPYVEVLGSEGESCPFRRVERHR